MTTKFRGKYLQINPVGTCHLVFRRTGHHYTWHKIPLTVHNIIVGRLWIDNSGEMDIINHNTGSCISAGGGVSDETSARIVKARAAYANLGHLWRLRDVSLAVSSDLQRVVEDVRRLSVFGHRCLRRMADIQWQHHISNAEVWHRVFGCRDDNPIGVTILKHRLRWPGHVLRMSSQRIPRCALFADAGTGWKKQRGGQCAVLDKSGDVRYVLNGTWDDSLEYAPVVSTRHSRNGKPVLETGPARVLWQSNPLPPDAERMYCFTRLALQLNEPDEDVCPTDSRLRPDQRLMEAGRWDEANRAKVELEELQRQRRRQMAAELAAQSLASSKQDETSDTHSKSESSVSEQYNSQSSPSASNLRKFSRVSGFLVFF
ncbi:unnamed protein product [Schistosoma mattheei]|uniref:Uncharacterized protein n=1 Tax=Schistosoma mattheei TaxID=31246 RepID=A0A183NJH4_9TREM|nr:unnamed protein product [Schistosoma mattheei]